MVNRSTTIKRGEVWLCEFDPTKGTEIQKTRPCAIVSPPEMCHLPMIFVAPMTTGSHPRPLRIPVNFQGKDGLIVLDQVRTVDRVRLTKRLGTTEPNTLNAALKALQEIFEP